MDRKGFISISVIYTLFTLFLMLLLSILTAYVNNRILLKISKGDTNQKLVDSEDNRDISYVCREQILGKCLANYANLDDTLFFHDANDIDSESNLEADDFAYRYSGANPNNYVCFGTNVSPCPIANKYRIIGVFNNKLKLIKVEALPARAWNTTNINKWLESDLNNYLNNYFLNTFPSEWRNLIVNDVWFIGGASNNDALMSNAQTAYKAIAKTNNCNGVCTITRKVGLMNLSDFYYAASPNNWTRPGFGMGANSNNYHNAKEENWLAGYDELLLTRNSDTTDQFYRTNATGYVSTTSVNTSLIYRPVFYLNQKVILISGKGFNDDPFYIGDELP